MSDKYVDEISNAIWQEYLSRESGEKMPSDNLKEIIQQQIRKAQRGVLEEIHFEALTSAKKEPERLGMLVAKAFFKKKNQLKEQTNDDQS